MKMEYLEEFLKCSMNDFSFKFDPNFPFFQETRLKTKKRKMLMSPPQKPEVVSTKIPEIFCISIFMHLYAFLCVLCIFMHFYAFSYIFVHFMHFGLVNFSAFFFAFSYSERIQDFFIILYYALD